MRRCGRRLDNPSSPSYRGNRGVAIIGVKRPDRFRPASRPVPMSGGGRLAAALESMAERQISTHLRRTRGGRRMTQMGQEEPFPSAEAEWPRRVEWGLGGDPVIFAQVIDVRRALARSGVYRKAEVSRHRSEICRCQATN